MFRKFKRHNKDKQTEWTKYDDKVIHAVESGDTTKLQSALTKKGTSPSKADHEGRTALHVAAKCGQFPSLEIMLALGANVSSKDAEGLTALHLTAKGGHLNSATRLIQAGTPVDTQDNSGKTPLHHAACEGHVECTILFLQSEATKEATDQYGKTPLLWASELGHVTVCKELIDRGANVNAQDNQKRTPLILACQNNRKEVVDLLVKRGARADMLDAMGHDANFYAADSINPNLKAALEAAPSVAMWDVKSEEEEKDTQPKPDSVDYIDKFDASVDRSDSLEPVKQDAKPPVPSRAISMPSLAIRENEEMRDIQELEEENDMLNDELQKVSVNHRKAIDRIKELELQLQQNDIATLQEMLDEEKEKNLQATQEIKSLRESQKERRRRTEMDREGHTEEEEVERRPDSWGDSDDDLFDLPGLGSSKPKTTGFQTSPSSKLSQFSSVEQKELERLREENQDLKSKVEALPQPSADGARIAELEQEIRKLRQQSPLQVDSSTNQELSSLQQEMGLQKEKLANLSSQVAAITEERDTLKKQLEAKMTPSLIFNSPKYHQLLKDNKELEESVNKQTKLINEQNTEMEEMRKLLSNSQTPNLPQNGIKSINGESETVKWREKYEELLKENTRYQTTISKQSKAIAQQTDRSRKDKQKYSALLGEKEKLESEFETLRKSGSRITSEDASSVPLLAECEKLRNRVTSLESDLETRTVDRERLEQLTAENWELQDKIRKSEDVRQKLGDSLNVNQNRVAREQTDQEVIDLKIENANLKSQWEKSERLRNTSTENDEAFVKFVAENENLKKTLNSQKAEIETLRDAQSSFSKKKYTEVLSENRKLKEALSKSHGVPNGSAKGGSGLGSSKAEIDKLRERLAEVEKKLNGTVAIYRQHLLSAVQDNMDPDVRHALLQIVKLRSTNGGTC